MEHSSQCSFQLRKSLNCFAEAGRACQAKDQLISSFMWLSLRFALATTAMNLGMGPFWLDPRGNYLMFNQYIFTYFEPPMDFSIKLL